MPQNELTITLAASGRLSVETLKESLKNALEMLHSLETEFVASGTEVRWEVVRVRMSSPLRLTVAPSIPPAIGRKMVKACLRGVGAIEKSASMPENFNEEALTAVKELFATASKDGATLAFSSNHKDKVTFSEIAVRHIDEVVSKARLYVDHGTLEGQLDEISVHGPPVVFVWERFPIRRIKCVITPELVEQGKALLGKRVSVTGRIAYRNHKPTSIQVESIHLMPDDDKLPNLADIQPIDITGGLSPEEYVRRMCDE